MVVESKSDSLFVFFGVDNFLSWKNTQKALSTPVAFTWHEQK